MGINFKKQILLGKPVMLKLHIPVQHAFEIYSKYLGLDSNRNLSGPPRVVILLN